MILQKGGSDSVGNILAGSPFSLDDNNSYRLFRDKKLKIALKQKDNYIIELKNPADITHSEKEKIMQYCNSSNMAIYTSSKKLTKEDLSKFALQFGLSTLDANPLSDDDGISSLQVSESNTVKEFIPYTDKAIQWHTDGYYNDADHLVRSIILHCETQAESGGENEFIDHELIYIFLRDKNPEYIKALMENDAMSIPPSLDSDGKELRPERVGPVFSVSEDGYLHMRYTARTRSISWKKSEILEEALSYMKSILSSENEYIIKARMTSNQGIICNNVLHNRKSFIDGENSRRLVYRARYYERITG